jgi:Flp pilus assembly pilin Flp
MNRDEKLVYRSTLERLRLGLRRLLRGQTSGATFIEYLLICGIVALGAIIGFRRLRASSDNTVVAQAEVVRTLGGVNGGPGQIFPGLGRRDPSLGPGLGGPILGGGPIAPLGPGGRRGLPVIQPSKCFAAGTPVLTADGERPIEAIAPGELVWSRDEATATDVLAPVRHLFVTPKTLVIGVEIPWDVGKLERIAVTPEHPFWVDGSGWVAASELNGAPLSATNGGTPLGSAVESWSEPTTVYNLEVEGQHSFFVGHSHVLVHNTCKYQPQSYRDWKKDPTKPAGTQVNHLNQDAVYGTKKGGKIPHADGVSSPLTGSTNDIGGEHYKFHLSLETFWDQYREDGPLAGQRPTNAQYGEAVEAALIAAGVPAVDAINLAEAAHRQRLDYGYKDSDKVPRVPGPIPGMKRKPPSAPTEDES